MANRLARRLREQEAAECLAREREALRQAKIKYKDARHPAALRRDFASFGLEPLLRRRSVVRCLMRSTGFYIAFWQLLESGQLVRDLNYWRTPRTSEPARMFRSLSRYGFLRYGMPEPLMRAITDALARDGNADPQTMRWFMLLARGENLSKAGDLPFDFPKKAAHFFLHAPREMALPTALRWAQLRALRMTDRLARPLAELLQAETAADETVWMDLFRFLLRYEAQIETRELAGIVAFVRAQRLTPYLIGVSNLTEPVAPLYPELRLIQATPASLRQRMEAWEDHLIVLEKSLRWRKFPASPIPEHFSVWIQERQFTIQRLRSVEELLQDGIAMKHCVGGYGQECARERTTIWSLRSLNRFGEFEREATLELTPDLRIIQAKAKCNQQPRAEAWQAVGHWAAANSLRRISW